MVVLVDCPRCRTTIRIAPQAERVMCGVCGAFMFREEGRACQRELPNNYCGGPSNGAFVPKVLRIKGNKRALLCGIDYIDTPYQLKGCINDVKCMKYLLTTKFNFPESSILTLTEEEKDPCQIPTKHNIRRAMHWLVQGCKYGDSLVFHYSGHGLQQPNLKGEEADGYDEVLCPLDFETNGMIVDDEINKIIVRPLPRGARLHGIIDACHSGTMLDLPFVYWVDKNGSCAWEDHRPPTGAWKGTNGGEAISISGCDDNQTSSDTKALAKVTSTGAMTYAFINAIENGDGMSYGSLLNTMRDSIYKLNKKNGSKSTLTNMLLSGHGFTNGRLQEPQLSSSFPFDVNEKPFYL